MDFCNDCNYSLDGIAVDCDRNVGGIIAVWAAPCNEVTSITVTDGVVTALATPEFKKYEVLPFSSGFNTAIGVNIENGTETFDTTIDLVIKKMTADKNAEITKLAIQGLVMVVKDANSDYWYFGDEIPVRMTDSTGTTGVARDDRNGYEISFINYGTHMPLALSSTIAPDAPAASASMPK